MSWNIVRLWLLLSLATLLAGVLLRPAPTLADGQLHHAGLVVRDGEGRITYAWVPFAEEKIDGIALLERSGIPVVTVGFGALGEGVCSIGGQGCGVSECRRNVCQAAAADAPYWQYFQQDRDDPSLWTWQALGPSASDVEDGDVFGWSWTAAAPNLPDVPAREIAALAGAGAGSGSEASVRTYLPEGVAPASPRHPPDARTTALAAGVLATIGLMAFLLSRRGAPGLDGARARPLDPRAWLLWAVAASLPPLLGRNPWPLAATLLAVLGVCGARAVGEAGARWRPLLRLALLFGAIGVLFNLLTAHVGDLVIATLPEHWPVIGGLVTPSSTASSAPLRSSPSSPLAPRWGQPLTGARRFASCRSAWLPWPWLGRWPGRICPARPPPCWRSARRKWRAVTVRDACAMPPRCSCRSSLAGSSAPS
jgi:hypothetical protein